jgi:hypothetical protein
MGHRESKQARIRDGDDKRYTNRPHAEYESDRGASNHSLSDGVRSVDPATTRVPAGFPDPALGATEHCY